MFERIEKKDELIKGSCFVVLKGTLDSFEDNVINFHNMKKSDYILFVLSKYPERFDFHEELAVNLDNKKPPQGMDVISEKYFTYRYSAEFSLSLQTLKELTDDRTTKYKGKQLSNPIKEKKILNTLEKNVIGIYVDILNEETKEWDRFETLSLSFVTSMHRMGCCLIS